VDFSIATGAHPEFFREVSFRVLERERGSRYVNLN